MRLNYSIRLDSEEHHLTTVFASEHKTKDISEARICTSVLILPASIFWFEATYDDKQIALRS